MNPQTQSVQEYEKDKDLALLIVADMLEALASRFEELSRCIRQLIDSSVYFLNHHCFNDGGGLFYDLQLS